MLGILTVISGASMILAALQVAQAQPRADPRRERLGRQRPRQDQHPVRRGADEDRPPAEGLHPHAQGPVRRRVEDDENRPLGHDPGARRRGRHELYPVDKRDNKSLVPPPRTPAKSRARRRRRLRPPLHRSLPRSIKSDRARYQPPGLDGVRSESAPSAFQQRTPQASVLGLVVLFVLESRTSRSSSSLRGNRNRRILVNDRGRERALED